MYPYERSLVKRFEGKPFALLGVNCDSSAEKAKKVMQREQMTWPSWYDGRGGPICEDWDITVIPSVFVLDHKGIVREEYEGFPDKRDVENLIFKLLAEIEAEQKAEK